MSELIELLGVCPGAGLPQIEWSQQVETQPGYSLHRFRMAALTGQTQGVLVLPEGQGPFPAVLYCHAHGNAYEIGHDELLSGRPALQSAYGPVLAQMGLASVAIDLAPFGSRQSEGPESALAKAAQWRGESLMGHMLHDLSNALFLLQGHEKVDAKRIATLGLSMGATHAYWMAALHPKIAACAHLCAFANIGPLVASGAHDLHGPYMTVPGFLLKGDMCDVAASIAPRPQLICAGAEDPLTPPEALQPALDRLRRRYREVGSAALEVMTVEGVGHIETPQMRQAVLAFLGRHLRA